MLNSEGIDITPPERDEEVPMIIDFRLTQDHTLKVAGSNRWSGDAVC